MEVQRWGNNIVYLGVILFVVPSCLCGFEKLVISELKNATLDIRSGDDSPGIHKCCPPDQGLVRLDLDGDELMYACTEVFQNNRNGSFNVSLEIPQVPLKTTSIELNVKIGFPTACKETGNFFEDLLTSVKTLPDEYCLDKVILMETNSTESIVKGSVVIISCGDEKPETGKNPVPRLRTVRKCCIGDQVYDTVNHTCIDAKNESTSKSNKPEESKTSANTRKDILKYFESLFDETVSLVDIANGLLPCLNPNVTYEYSSAKYNFKMLGNNMNLIGDGKPMSFGPESYCIDRSPEETVIVRGCSSPRKDLPFVIKCCPEGQVYMPANSTCRSKSSCAVNPSFGFSPSFYDISNPEAPSLVDPPSSFGIQYTPNCPAGKYILMPSKSNPKDYSYLDAESGLMFIPGLPSPMQPEYCMEVFDSQCTGRKPELYTFNCFPVAADKVTAKLNKKLQVFSIGLIISCVFLAATLIVYLALPPLQNLHGRTMMCHVAAMLVAYSCLARVQWSQVPRHSCKILGYAIYFSFLAAFSWLNIMCFDIWWTLGNIRGMQHSKDRKKLLLFSLYAWGVPFIMTTTAYLLDTYDVYVGILDPNIGHSQCWFATGQYTWPVLILFILPVGIQIGINSILFVLTALHCSKVKSEIHRMQAGSTGDKTKRRFMADKAKYSMNMKLFVVMGITWVTEIISSIYNEPYELWYAADAINVLQGIPIFIILVMKKKVYLLMRKRLGLEKKKKPIGGATTTTGISSDSCTDPLSGKKYSRQFSTSSGFRTNMSGKSDL